MRASALFMIFVAATPLLGLGSQTKTPTVTITGGYETDPRDRGRPVVLIAAGLGVPSDVFREAFSHVRPAPAGEAPDPEQVRRNKGELMSALAKYGVSNESLDRVSNYYRYNRSRGEWWPYRAAKVEAIFSHGTVTGFKIVDPGAGYSSPPTITVAGSNVTTVVTLAFGRDLAKNGSIASIKIVSKCG